MIRETIFSMGEFLNFHLVYATYGYLGDMHRAINFAYSSGHLMLVIRPMLFHQAERRGIPPQNIAFCEKKYLPKLTLLTENSEEKKHG